MTKDVLVAVKGTQMFVQNEEDAEPIETIMAGDYYNKNGKHYIIYEEVMEGFEGSTRNIVKLNKDSVDITKKGLPMFIWYLIRIKIMLPVIRLLMEILWLESMPSPLISKRRMSVFL